MGWLHVIDEGFGIYFNESEVAKFLDNLPLLGIDIDDILSEFPNVKQLEETQKYLFLGAIQDKYFFDDYIGKKNYNEVTSEDIQEAAESSYYFTKDCIVDILDILFEKKYNYPEGTFRSCRDYNGDCMFYVAAKFPIYDERLLTLTRDNLEKQMQEFFDILYGKHIDLEFEEVEEYIKE